MKLFISPHNDDETLFGSFLIQREKPALLVVFDSHLQHAREGFVEGRPSYLDWKARRAETLRAWSALGRRPEDVHFLGLRDDEPHAVEAIRFQIRLWMENQRIVTKIDHVFVPALEETGHDHHNAVALAMVDWPAVKRTNYLTYTRSFGKSRGGQAVPVEKSEWISRKLRALAEYTSQIELSNCREHFTRDLLEYTR